MEFILPHVLVHSATEVGRRDHYRVSTIASVEFTLAFFGVAHKLETIALLRSRVRVLRGIFTEGR